MTDHVAPPGADAPAARAFKVELLLASFAGLLLEISYTRVVSFKLFYYYTYLVIGLALLGIGAGGVVVAVSRRLQRAATETIVMWSLLITAIGVGIGYVVMARVSIDTLAIWDYGSRSSFSNVGRLLFICLAVFGAFVPIGVLVATLFGRRSEQIGRLYFADLLGAGLACAVVVFLVGSIGPPATIMLAGLVVAVAALRLAWRERSRLVAGVTVVVAVLLGVATVSPSVLPAQREDATKVDFSHGALYSSWSPVFRVDVAQPNPAVRLLYHDGLLGSAIYRWDGRLASLGRFDGAPAKLPFAVAVRPKAKVLIIGAAGGNEILASLHFRARHVDAVELNPVTYNLVTHDYARYDGHIAQNPRVNYVNGEGRTYLARSGKHYNLIWYPAPDSYSATNAATSGAFVLSESYLYTSNAIEDSLRHLAPGGLIAAQFGEFDVKHSTRTARYVATARHALAALGVHDPRRHILVATSGIGAPLSLTANFSTILVKRTPFTAAEIARFTGAMPSIAGARTLYASGVRVRANPIATVASLPASRLGDFYDSYQYSVGPITDNGPFFWHFTSFNDVIRNFTRPIVRGNFELSIGERVLLLLLVVATLLAALFLLLPFVAIRKVWVQLPKKPNAALYFAALGFGFIFLEVTLIQRLTLFLGYPTYSLTVTLASLLIFTGLGALAGGQTATRLRSRVPLLLGAIALLVVFYAFALPPITDALLPLPLAARIPVAFVVLAPLGLCLGTFMPLGIGVVAELSPWSREYVAWAWAVNGFASVAGSVLATILAMSFGFNVVLLVALAAYAVAFLALRRLLRSIPSWSPAG